MSRQLPRGEGDLPRLRTLEPEPCVGKPCGEAVGGVDTNGPRFVGWIGVEVLGSADPARLYCSPRCASVGIARAQLRTGAT